MAGSEVENLDESDGENRPVVVELSRQNGECQFEGILDASTDPEGNAGENARTDADASTDPEAMPVAVEQPQFEVVQEEPADYTSSDPGAPVAVPMSFQNRFEYRTSDDPQDLPEPIGVQVSIGKMPTENLGSDFCGRETAIHSNSNQGYCESLHITETEAQPAAQDANEEQFGLRGSRSSGMWAPTAMQFDGEVGTRNSVTSKGLNIEQQYAPRAEDQFGQTGFRSSSVAAPIAIQLKCGVGARDSVVSEGMLPQKEYSQGFLEQIGCFEHLDSERHADFGLNATETLKADPGCLNAGKTLKESKAARRARKSKYSKAFLDTLGCYADMDIIVEGHAEPSPTGSDGPKGVDNISSESKPPGRPSLRDQSPPIGWARTAKEDIEAARASRRTVSRRTELELRLRQCPDEEPIWYEKKVSLKWLLITAGCLVCIIIILIIIVASSGSSGPKAPSKATETCGPPETSAKCPDKLGNVCYIPCPDELIPEKVIYCDVATKKWKTVKEISAAECKSSSSESSTLTS